MRILFLYILLFITITGYAQYNVGTTYCNHSDLNTSKYQPSELDLGNKTWQLGFNYYLWMGNNNFNYSNLKKAYNGEDIDFLSVNAKKNNSLGVGQDYQLFGIAYQVTEQDDKRYVFSFSVVDKFAMNFKYTDTFLKLALRGNKQYAGQRVDLSPVTVNTNYSRDFVLGAAFPIIGNSSKGLRFGIRAKLIQGLGSIYMPKGNAVITTEQNGRYVEMDFDYAIYTSGLSDFSFFKAKGWGAGIDIGLTYNISENIEISGSVLDLGYINYSNNTRSYKKTGTGHYEGLVIDNLFGGSKQNLDSANAIINADKETGIKYKMPLGTRVAIELEYKISRKENAHGKRQSSIFVTYIQGLNDWPGTTKRPFISAGYNHDFNTFFDAGGLLAVGGYNNIAIGTFFSFNIKETIKVGFSSDNITALILPYKGTGIDFCTNFSLSF